MKFDGRLYNPKRGQEHRVPVIKTVKKNEDGEWEETDKHLYMNEYLYENIREMKRIVKTQNDDVLIGVDGKEGSGKSTIARQVAKAIDPKFTHDQICFSAEQLIKKHEQMPKYRALVFDEAGEDMDRKNTMSKKSKFLMNFLRQSRQENLFVIVVQPSVFNLDKYVAQERMKFLIHTYKKDGRHPGYFSFFGPRAIANLFKYNHKYRTYGQRPAFSGRFLHEQVVNLDRYNELKKAALQKFYDRVNNNEAARTEDEIIRDFIVDRLLALEDNDEFEPDLTQEELGEIFGYTRATLWRWKKERLEADSED